MGQKAHPYGLRLGYIKPWRAKWFARRQIGELLGEDLKLRAYIKKKLGFAGIASVEIERSGGKVRVRIFTARPGVIIGRRGQEIDKIKDDLSKLTKNELFIDIKEVKNPQINAQLVAENVALQLEKRIGFRRAMKKTLQTAMMKGAGGMKILCKGRLGGAEIAREEKYAQGKIPLSTFRADIDYGFAEAHTTYGSIGCKVWIYKGDILVKKEEAAQKAEREKRRQARDVEQQKEARAKKAAAEGEKKAVAAVETAEASEAEGVASEENKQGEGV